MALRSVLVAAVLALLGRNAALAACVFTQDDPNATPRPLNNTPPFPLVGLPPMLIACPQYESLGCCNTAQAQSLWVHAQTIWAAFGNPTNGGCPACYQNVMDFWCAFTCSPNQDKFVSVVGESTKVDPISGNPTLVLETTMRIDAKFACTVFDSCKSTGKVVEDAPQHMCEGFFAYQGQYEAINAGKSYINFNWTSPEVAAAAANDTLQLPTHSCCNYENNIVGPSFPYKPATGNTSCACDSCAGMCAGGSCEAGNSTGGNSTDNWPNLGVVNIPTLQGFNGVFLGAWYGAIAAVTILVTVGRNWGAIRKAVAAR